MEVYDSPQAIANFRLRSLRGALKLEIAGMKRRGRSVYSIIKEEFSTLVTLKHHGQRLINLVLRQCIDLTQELSHLANMLVIALIRTELLLIDGDIITPLMELVVGLTKSYQRVMVLQ